MLHAGLARQWQVSLTLTVGLVTIHVAWLQTSAFEAAQTREVAHDSKAGPCSVEHLRCSDPALQGKFKCFTATAKKIAKAGWFAKPFAMTSQGVCTAEWATFAGEGGEVPWNYTGAKELQCLSLSVFLDPEKAEEMVGFAASGLWRPAEAGWQARVRYITSHGRRAPAGKGEGFHINLEGRNGPGDGERKFPSISITPRGLAFFHKIHVFGDTKYTIEVVNREAAAALVPNKRTPDSQVRKMLESAESMRNFAMGAYKELLVKLPVQILTGRAVRSAMLAKTAFKQNPLSSRELVLFPVHKFRVCYSHAAMPLCVC